MDGWHGPAMEVKQGKYGKCGVTDQTGRQHYKPVSTFPPAVEHSLPSQGMSSTRRTIKRHGQQNG